MIHISYGYCKHEPDEGDHCLFCAHEPEAGEMFAYTYFGAPVCGRCWDEHWRDTEDGQTDPPFADIKYEVSGEWL